MLPSLIAVNNEVQCDNDKQIDNESFMHHIISLKLSTPMEENLCGFCGFSTNRESFPY